MTYARAPQENEIIGDGIVSLPRMRSSSPLVWSMRKMVCWIPLKILYADDPTAHAFRAQKLSWEHN